MSKIYGETCCLGSDRLQKCDKVTAEHPCHRPGRDGGWKRGCVQGLSEESQEEENHTTANQCCGNKSGQTHSLKSQ